MAAANDIKLLLTLVATAIISVVAVSQLVRYGVYWRRTADTAMLIIALFMFAVALDNIWSFTTQLMTETMDFSPVTMASMLDLRLVERGIYIICLVAIEAISRQIRRRDR